MPPRNFEILTDCIIVDEEGHLERMLNPDLDRTCQTEHSNDDAHTDKVFINTQTQILGLLCYNETKTDLPTTSLIKNMTRCI